MSNLDYQEELKSFREVLCGIAKKAIKDLEENEIQVWNISKGRYIPQNPNIEQ